MNMELHPILSSLRRSPTGAILVALQIALALAITVNCLYIVQQRVEKVGEDPGFDLANTFVVSFAPIGRSFNGAAAMREDIQLLRSLPGVVDATTINNLPLSGGGSSTSYYTQPGEKGEKSPVNYFMVDEHGVNTLGVKLVEGRNFDPSVVTKPERNSSDFVPEVILSRAVEKELFKGKSGLGKQVYDSLGSPATVVGIYELMHGSWPMWDKLDHTGLHPTIADEQWAMYLVRAQPGRRDELMKIAEAKLSALENGRIITRVRSLEQFAAGSYADDRAMAVYLAAVTVLLLGIASLGIFGLASFNVSTRTKQIGTRRAIGARRRDIIRYFLTENWLITSVGVATGCVLALLLGYWLSTTFELPRLNLYYLVAGVVVLWVVGLASALVPARRASLVSPAIATRTV
jgi:putative ABC transport system permease protein